MSAIKMHDAGRSWKEIAQANNLTIAEAMQEVAEEKRKRRESLAHTPENERARGLLDECQAGYLSFTCLHARKHHDHRGCKICRTKSDAESRCDGFQDKATLFQGRSTSFVNDVYTKLYNAYVEKHGIDGARERLGLVSRWSRTSTPKTRQKRELSRLRRKAKKRD